MALKRIALWLGGMVLLTAFMFGQVRQWQQVLANDEVVSEDGPQIGFVIDTTASMQPEIDALTQAVGISDLTQLSKPTFHRVPFKDAAVYQGSLTNTTALINWLGSIEAQGGEDCPDNTLQALITLARNMPGGDALLLSDAAPQGGRRGLAFVMGKLVERDISIFPVVTGWCAGADLSLESMIHLARITGGLVSFADVSEVLTATTSTLNHMAQTDRLLNRFSDVSGLTIYDLSLDSTIDTIELSAKCCYCLTCTRQIAAPAMITQLQLRDPEGNILQPGDPGVDYYETNYSAGYRVSLDELGYSPWLTDTWQIGIEAPYWHMLSVAANSQVHFSYLSDPVLPAGRPTLIRVNLSLEPPTPGQSAAPNSPTLDFEEIRFGIQSANGGLVAPIDLFDDGQHGDGAAGDGIFGGVVTPAKGLWTILADGSLDDGSLFRRVDPTPIRAVRFGVRPPADSMALPNSTLMQDFTVTNDSEDSQSFELLVSSSQGWAMTSTLPAMVTLAAGETAVYQIPLTIPTNAPVGTVEETSLTLVDENDIFSTQTATSAITVVDELQIFLPAILRPN